MRKSWSVFVGALVAAFISVAGPALATGSSCGSELADSMNDAASSVGVQIYSDQMVTVSTPEATIAATTVQGCEETSGWDLSTGVNIGFLYIDAPDSGLDTGFYTVRALAKPEDVKLGEFDGTLQLVSENGEVAAGSRATVNMSLPAVTDLLPHPRPTVDVSARRKWSDNYIMFDYWNEEGVHVRFFAWLWPDW